MLVVVGREGGDGDRFSYVSDLVGLAFGGANNVRNSEHLIWESLYEEGRSDMQLVVQSTLLLPSMRLSECSYGQQHLHGMFIDSLVKSARFNSDR